MPKILQINITANWGSTGKIAEQIGVCAMSRGWDSYIAYGRCANPSNSKLVRIGSSFNTYEHYMENRILDKEGLASERTTKKFIKQIREINPDVIHLHNIHDHFLNYPLLFDYLSTIDIPVIWTQHDCWGFTGGCKYYDMIGCDKWQLGCKDCTENRALFCNRAEVQYLKKKSSILSLRDLTLVPVSMWLSRELKKSFLKDYPIVPILNGVDVDTFRPMNGGNIRSKYDVGDRPMLLGVANIWEKRKGLLDYMQLGSVLGDDYSIVLLGLNDKQMRDLPANVVGVKRTENIEEMVALYSAADIVLNLSYEETFGLTTVEGFACGTPSIVYNKTACPELITDETGKIVNAGAIDEVKVAIEEILAKGKTFYSNACRKRAVEYYDKNKCFEKYIELYENLIKRC